MSNTKIKAMLKRYGLKGLNKAKMTPDHPKKKAVVLASENGKVKIVRFGAKGYGHNYSPKARKSYLARSGGIKNGKTKLGANYWARKILWAGKGGSVASNPRD